MNKTAELLHEMKEKEEKIIVDKSAELLRPFLLEVIESVKQFYEISE